jgi:hypothetical protein
MSANSGLVVNVIDNHKGDRHDRYLPKCRMLHPKHLNCHSVHSMVIAVTNAAKSGKISVLRIFGHGHPGSQAVGGGRNPNHHQKFWVDHGGKLHHQAMLQPLRHLFTPNAIVQLHGCEVAEKHIGLLFLQRLSHLWHVEVMAALDAQKAHKKGAYNGLYIGVKGKLIYGYHLDQDALTTP